MIDHGIKAQMCVTSPPYYGLRDYGDARQIGLEKTPDEYIALLIECFALVRDVLADDGTLWLNLGDSYANDGKWGGSSGGKHAAALHGNTGIGRGKVSTGLPPKNLIGIPWRVAFALQSDGWYLRQDLVWHKPNAMPESVKDRCTRAHEYIFLLSKNGRYFFDCDAIREPAVGGGSSAACSFKRAACNKREQATTPAQRYGTHRPGRADVSYNGDTRNRRSVWTIPTAPFKGAHFAVFPPALIIPCILAGSRPGDVVLDPFFGSGTTGRVAQQLGRKWVGCEINEDYAAMHPKPSDKPTA
ncbi:MAG: site-specific DNA-methyltransferase [Methylococcaceae bacterium]|nr:MAG: site-specific DNA-methyltransferase [Methylococcaceae bacterium]